MVKIFSPLRGADPIAKAFRDFGQQMFGDQTTNALNNEKLYAAQRENTETDNLMKRIAGGGGAQAITADPISQAILLGSGYDPNKFNSMALMGGATQFGAADPRTQNLQVGSGQSFDNTASAVNAKLAETARNNDMASADRRYGVDQAQGTERYKFQNEPKPALGPNGQPTFAPQGNLTTGGFQPILSDTERKGTFAGQNFGNMGTLPAPEQEYLGALPGSAGGSRTPKNYIVAGQDGRPNTFMTIDGVTDVQTGQRLPPGGYIGTVQGGAGDVGLTNSTLSGLQQGQISYDNFKAIADLAEPLTQDPQLFGVQGFVRSKAQNILQTLGGVSAVVGARDNLAKSLVSAETGQLLGPEAVKALIPEFYDPRLDEVESLWAVLLYRGAAALAGQENRSVSDQDIVNMRAALGDPQSLFASNLSMKAKLDSARKVVEASRAVNQKYLGNGVQPPPNGGNAPPPAATPRQTSSGVQWSIDP